MQTDGVSPPRSRYLGSMRFSLERLDTRGFILEIPGASEQAVIIASTENLQGRVAIDDGKTTLEGVQADAIVLSSLRLLLGRLVLSGRSGARLTGVGVALERTPDRLGLDTNASSLAAAELHIEIDDIAVRGRVHLAGVKLLVQGERGSLSAERVTIEAFSLRLGDVELGAETVHGAAVAISWGDSFGLRAGTLESPALRVVTPAARVLASDVATSAFVLDDGKVTARRAATRSARVEARFAKTEPASSAAPPAPATTRAPLFDPNVLDALSGQLDVDVELDLTVPIIGRRRATHRLRVAIDQGTIDYLALERNLSALEDAILDFAVRDGGLALERVNPLFPARGRGKPIIAWPLDEADLELATQNRVRLSVLPRATVVGSDEPSDAGAAPKKSAVALRHLGLVNIGARLALAPTGVLGGQIRPKRIGALVLGGDVYYDPGEATPPGLLRGEADALAVSLHRLSLGASTLDASIEVANVSGLEVAFADVTPTAMKLDLADLVVADLAIVPGD